MPTAYYIGLSADADAYKSTNSLYKTKAWDTLLSVGQTLGAFFRSFTVSFDEQ